jgi:hypothetical protein
MDGPHLVLLGNAVQDVNAGAVGELDQCGMTKTGLLINSAWDGGAASDAACAKNSDILRIDGGDERAVPFNPTAFPANLRERVIGEVSRTEERRAVLEMKIGVRVEGDGADDVVPLRDENLSTPEEAATIERLLEGKCVLGGSVAGCAEVADVELCALRNERRRGDDAAWCGGEPKRG